MACHCATHEPNTDTAASHPCWLCHLGGWLASRAWAGIAGTRAGHGQARTSGKDVVMSVYVVGNTRGFKVMETAITDQGHTRVNLVYA